MHYCTPNSGIGFIIHTHLLKMATHFLSRKLYLKAACAVIKKKAVPPTFESQPTPLTLNITESLRILSKEECQCMVTVSVWKQVGDALLLSLLKTHRNAALAF